MLNRSNGADKVGSTVEMNTGAGTCAAGGGVFYVECYDKDGNLKWSNTAKNMVVNTGLQDMNNKYFTGSAYTAAWYIGLVSDSGFTGYSASDTLASHAGWAETTDYSGSNRPTANFASASLADPSVVTNNASQATFVMSGSVVIKGAFLCNVQDKTSTSGLLFSAANFESPGDRTVVSGDTLNVRYDFSLADA